MKEGRTIFNMKNEDLIRNLSKKLLVAFNVSKYHLEYQFICLRCFGISVNALYCKECKYSYCDNCFQLLPASKIICICRKTSKENFGLQINNELFNTYYYIQDKSSLTISQISYSESLTWHNESPYTFFPSEDCHPTTNEVKKYNQIFRLTSSQVSSHQTNYLHPFSLKEARLINFNFSKGYPLDLYGKVLCAKDGNFLRIIHLAKIELQLCNWNIDFSFYLSNAIRNNKNKLLKIKVDDYLQEINLKSYLIMFNAVTFCSKLDIISLNFGYKYFEDKLIPKSFYEFISNSYNLKEILFCGFAFHDYMNFKPFQRLVPLESLSLSNCAFNFNSFEYMYHNNFPILQKLLLKNNKITNSLTNKNTGLEIPPLHKTIKFPSILSINIYSSDSLENLLLEALIKAESIKLKSLFLWFNYEWNSKLIPTFFIFSKVSNIQFLSLVNLKNTQAFDSNEFCEFLRNSKFLKGLKLTFSKEDDFNAGLILQALSVNRSIKILYLKYMHLSNFCSDLINLILSNRVITILSLYEPNIQIDLNFINAFSRNKSVSYLDLSGNQINDVFAEKISQLNLKGIDVENTGISNSNEEIIYKSIPKFKAPYDILECEKFLKENIVN